MDDFASIPDYGLGWLDASGPSSEIVLSTRVRLARNLQGHAFGPRSRVNDREAVLKLVRAAVREIILPHRRDPLGAGGARSPNPEDPPGEAAGLERPARGRKGEPPRGAAVLLSATDPMSVMVNEEDHLRLQSLLSGLRLQDAWGLVDRLDEELGKELPLAYHHEFGFLTSCPTNVGTGLRASVLMHLPGLVLTKEIGQVLKGLNQVGLTFRGLYGEGSEVVGNFFQVSNQTTLGKTEEDLVDHLDRIVRQVIQYEEKARQVTS